MPPPPWRVWIENLALNPGLVKDSPTRRVPLNCCPKLLTLIPADPSSCQKIRDTLGWLAVHAAVATGPGGNHPPLIYGAEKVLARSSSTFVQKSISYLSANRRRLLPFIVIGGTAFLINWGLFKLFRTGGMTSRVQVNLALAVSMEISILYNFALQYRWTWKDTVRLRGWRYLAQAATFHGAVGVGAVLRLILFPIGQLIDLQDDLNFVIGVAAAALIDFVLYDKMVFKKAAH